MPEYILGISYGHHESSCCLFSSDGSVEYIREEWVSRVKNDFRFPIFSLSYLKKKYPKFTEAEFTKTKELIGEILD